MRRRSLGGEDQEHETRLTSRFTTEGLLSQRKRPYELLGYFVAVYLAPLLLRKTHESRCMYFILMPWCWWLLNTVSKPVAAFLPVVTFPVFNILTVDQIYTEYFTLQGMAVTALLCLAVVGDTVPTLVPRVTFWTCALFGLRSRLLFVALSLAAFVGALFVSNFIIAVFIMFIVDKVIRLAHKETVKNFKQLESGKASRRSIDRSSVDTEILLEKLATSIKTLDSLKRKVKRPPGSRRISKVKRRTPEAETAPAQVRADDGTRKEKKKASTAPQQAEGQQPEPPAPKRRLKRGCDVDMFPLPKINKKRHSVGFAELRCLLQMSPHKEDTGMDNVLDLSSIAKARTTASNSTSLTAEQLQTPTTRRMSIMKDPRLPGRRRSLQMDRRLSVLQFKANTPARDVMNAPLCTFDAQKQSHTTATSLESAQRKVSRVDNIADAPAVHATNLYGVRMSLDGLSGHCDSDDNAHLLDQHEKIYLAARNAFLIAPTLMTVTATWPSFWTMPAKGAFETHFQRYGFFRSPLFASSWSFLTLIGSVLSSTFGCVFLYAVNLHELEPELHLDLEPDIVDYAVRKLHEIGPLRQGEHLYCLWVAAYGICFGITAALGVDPNVGQTCILSGMVLMTSVLASLYNRDMVTRNVLCGKMPWNVLLTFGGSQAITKAVQANNLVEVMFHFFDAKFWKSRSSLVSQIYLATLSGILAEMVNNVTLSRLLMPVLLEIAAQRQEHPLYYAIPVALAACTNLILPISLPLIILHDIIEVPMQQLIVAGLTMKVIFVASIIITTNMMGNTLFQWSGTPSMGTSVTNMSIPQDIQRTSSTPAS